MINDCEKTAEYIGSWIEERAKEAHAKRLVLGISGGIDSALVAAICKRHTHLDVIGVLMPCQSSPSSIERGMELVTTFNIDYLMVDLEVPFLSIRQQVWFGIGWNSNIRDKAKSNEALGALRSCLRAPTLDYVGKVYDGIIVGTGNRDEDEVTRYFQKRGDGCVDISPIAKLHKSEVYQLAAHLGVPESILKATPSADLWGPDAGQEDEKQLGLSYAEVEWGIQTAEAYSGGTRKEDFEKALNNGEFGPREASVLAVLGEMEFASRHKENPALPVCDVRAAGFTGEVDQTA
jgi:NAD+ synthase